MKKVKIFLAISLLLLIAVIIWFISSRPEKTETLSLREQYQQELNQPNEGE